MNKIKNILIFFLGFFSCAFILLSISYSNIEVPFQNQILIFPNYSTISPSDSVAEENILLYKDRIILLIPGASISNYAPTGSMRPLLDEGSNGIRIVPNSEDEIKIGDIISYQAGNNLIVHRVIKKGFDEEGIYFITKGDNNSFEDEKIRFSDIKYKTIGILW